jgi:hypothetical protein
MQRVQANNGAQQGTILRKDPLPISNEAMDLPCSDSLPLYCTLLLKSSKPVFRCRAAFTSLFPKR